MSLPNSDSRVRPLLLVGLPAICAFGPAVAAVAGTWAGVNASGIPMVLRVSNAGIFLDMLVAACLGLLPAGRALHAQDRGAARVALAVPLALVLVVCTEIAIGTVARDVDLSAMFFPCTRTLWSAAFAVTDYRIFILGCFAICVFMPLAFCVDFALLLPQVMFISLVPHIAFVVGAAAASALGVTIALRLDGTWPRKRSGRLRRAASEPRD